MKRSVSFQLNKGEFSLLVDFYISRNFSELHFFAEKKISGDNPNSVFCPWLFFINDNKLCLWGKESVLLFREKSMCFESQSEVWAIWGQLCMGFFSSRRSVFNSITFGLLCIWKLRLSWELLWGDYHECVSEINQMGSRTIIKRVFTQSPLRTWTEIVP